MVTRSSLIGGLPPRKINLRDTLLPSREQKMLRGLLEDTNIMTKTLHEVFKVEVDDKDIRNVFFAIHGQGYYRAAYRVRMDVRNIGPLETIFKISHYAFPAFVLHQVLGNIVDPRKDVAAITAGLWELDNKKAVMTEEFIVGETFDSYISRNYKPDFKLRLATLLMKRCFLFWKDFHHIFITDPHRYQFIVVENGGKHGIKIIDTGSVSTVDEITYEILNDGDVRIKNSKAETVPTLDWIYKTPPRELLQNIIFNMEKPDEVAGGDFSSLDGEYQKGYDLPRIAIYDGIMHVFGRKDGLGFLREVQGIDPELDKIAEQKSIR